jgi:hypothetical protein
MSDNRPRWLEGDPEVLAWLHGVLDRLERQPGDTRKEPLRFTVDERLFPGLFHFGPEADARWELITGLAKHGLPLKVTAKRHRDPRDPEYVGARLAVDAGGENLIREWLRRPRVTPEAQAWREAVDAVAADWSSAARVRLRERRVHIPGRSAREVVDALVRLGALKGQGYTLRQLSAAVFFGDSKFLEQHCAALVEALYPDLAPAPRPLVIDVFLPARIDTVLFIENLDTYLRALAGELAATRGCALVYAAGFKGGAARIREPGCAALHYAGGCASREGFERWWRGAETPGWPVYFWGDLDFEGMGILKSLHRLFGATAWQPGYEPLLRWLQQGRGHLLEAADKLLQKDPETTGCPYADQVLLPALRSSQSGVDQEAFAAAT